MAASNILNQAYLAMQFLEVAHTIVFQVVLKKVRLLFSLKLIYSVDSHCCGKVREFVPFPPSSAPVSSVSLVHHTFAKRRVNTEL